MAFALTTGGKTRPPKTLMINTQTTLQQKWPSLISWQRVRDKKIKIISSLANKRGNKHFSEKNLSSSYLLAHSHPLTHSSLSQNNYSLSLGSCGKRRRKNKNPSLITDLSSLSALSKTFKEKSRRGSFLFFLETNALPHHHPITFVKPPDTPLYHLCFCMSSVASHHLNAVNT